MNVNKPKTDEAGFTLVEVLISLSILALIVSLSSAAIVFASNASSRAGTSTQDRRITAVRQVVERLIEGALPVTATIEEDSAGMAFIGERDQVLFIGQGPVPTDAPGLYAIELSFEAIEPERRLVLSYWPYRPTNPILPKPEEANERELVPNLESMEILYGSFDVRQGWTWRTEWSPPNKTLPHAVIISLQGGTGDERFQTDWFVPILLRRTEQDRR